MLVDALRTLDFRRTRSLQTCSLSVPPPTPAPPFFIAAEVVHRSISNQHLNSLLTLFWSLLHRAPFLDWLTELTWDRIRDGFKEKYKIKSVNIRLPTFTLHRQEAAYNRWRKKPLNFPCWLPECLSYSCAFILYVGHISFCCTRCQSKSKGWGPTKNKMFYIGVNLCVSCSILQDGIF